MATVAPHGNLAPSATLEAAMQKVVDAINALPPDQQTDIKNAVGWLAPAIQSELDDVADQYLQKLPIFGGVADGIVKNAIASALDGALAELTAAKAKVA